jgi:hypothetical protein
MVNAYGISAGKTGERYHLTVIGADGRIKLK